MVASMIQKIQQLYYAILVPQTNLAPMARERKAALLRYRFETKYHQVLVLCGISTLSYLGFYFSNSLLMPSMQAQLQILHSVIFVVSVSLMAALWRFVRDPRVWDFCFCLMVACSSLSWLCLVFVSDDDFSGVYVMGYLLYVLMVYLVVMYKFIYAVATTVLMTLAAGAVFYVRFASHNPLQMWEFGILACGVFMMGVHVSWFNLLHGYREFDQHDQQLSRQSELQDEKQQLQQQTQTDQMMGIYNRAYFMRRYAQLLRQYIGSNLGLLIVDVDHFKLINDNCGHLYGDEVLIKIAKCLQHVISDAFSGELYRLGGEEFSVLAPCRDNEHLALIANRLVAEVANLRLAHEFREDSLRYITISVGGVLCCGEGATLSERMRNADAAMYQAKRAGRNGYVIHH